MRQPLPSMSANSSSDQLSDQIPNSELQIPNKFQIQIFKSSNLQIFKSSNLQIFKSPNRQIAKSRKTPYLCKKISPMSTGERSFNENLDLLIRLLRKMKDKSQFEGIPGVPKSFVANFEFFIQNYERMKDQIAAQLLQQFGEPIKQMVADMVDQLKEELDEDPMLATPDEPASPAEIPVITGQKKTVEEIDEMLRKPGLSEEEIDRLLDERKKVKSEE